MSNYSVYAPASYSWPVLKNNDTVSRLCKNQTTNQCAVIQSSNILGSLSNVAGDAGDADDNASVSKKKFTSQSRNYLDLFGVSIGLRISSNHDVYAEDNVN